MQIILSFEQRQKSRLRVALPYGGEAAFLLPRGKVLRHGEHIVAADGRRFEVQAAPEKLLHVEADELARVAYHLGNRHVPVQIGAGFLRLAEDHVLEEMLRKLGARVFRIEAPFDPEAGAYHRHEDVEHGGKDP